MEASEAREFDTAPIVLDGSDVEKMSEGEWRRFIVRRLERLDRIGRRAEKSGLAAAAVLIGDVAVERWLPKIIEHLPSLLENLR